MVMLNEPFLFDDPLNRQLNQQRKERIAAIEQGIIAIEMMMEMYQDNDSVDEVAILVQHAVVLQDFIDWIKATEFDPEKLLNSPDLP